LHEVFAIHCVGEKRWRIYANRAENPLAPLEGDDAQARIDAAKGPVLMDVTLRPGDVLYIPRGYFHDALASSAESLHLTIGIAPH
ncbi:JmjC domain-containing protein, partial [Enterobacter hormaechei]